MKEIPLVGKKGAGRVALVDDEDYELVMQYRWRLLESRRQGRLNIVPYAITEVRRDGRRTSQLMHSMITGWPLVDHFDHDGLNNRRWNLRPATGSQNSANSRVYLKAKSSRFKGVTWYRRNRKWGARICVNGTHRHLGLFTSEEDAALAYNAAALKAFGEYAFPNQVPGMEVAA